MDASNADQVLHRVNTKFYVMAHYSRHVRPGMKIINGGDGNTVAAYDNNKGAVKGFYIPFLPS